MKAFAEAGLRVAALVLVAAPLVWMIVSYRDAQFRWAEEMKASLDTPVPNDSRARESILTQLRSGDVPPPQTGDAALVAKRAP